MRLNDSDDEGFQQALQDTIDTIAQLERALVAHPDSPVIRLNLESVSNRFDELQASFMERADRNKPSVSDVREAGEIGASASGARPPEKR